jgi:hypothetical protein
VSEHTKVHEGPKRGMSCHVREKEAQELSTEDFGR